MSIETDVTLNRERGIGGSEIPAILGISPFTTRWELLQMKTGQITNDFNGSEYTRYGQEMEPKIRDYVNEHFDMDFEPDYIEVEKDKPLSLFYHSDGHSETHKATLEIKTTSQIAREIDAEKAKIAFEDYEWHFYQKYYAQLCYGATLHEDKEIWLAVYDRPDDMSTDFDPNRLFVSTWKIEGSKSYIEPLVKRIWHAIQAFRVDYLFLEDNPWSGESDLPSFSALQPLQEQLMQIEGSIAQAQEIMKRYDDLKTQLCDKMGEFGIKSWTMPSGTKVTYVERGMDKTVKKFNEKAFQKDHDDLYLEYLEDKTQKGKSAYVRITPMAKGKKTQD